jgi:hypothetical protein
VKTEAANTTQAFYTRADIGGKTSIPRILSKHPLNPPEQAAA